MIDRDNIEYYVDPSSTSKMVRIESTDYIRAPKIESTNYVKAPKVIDRDNTNYYIDPAGYSKMNKIEATDYIKAPKICIGGDCRSSWPKYNFPSRAIVFYRKGMKMITWLGEPATIRKIKSYLESRLDACVVYKYDIATNEWIYNPSAPVNPGDTLAVYCIRSGVAVLPIDIRSTWGLTTGWLNVEYDLNVYDDLAVHGTKNAIVNTSQGMRKMYAMEAPTVNFATASSGKLVNGEARINIEQLFLETINTSAGYLVLLTLTDACTLYVAEKGENYFVVKLINGKEN